MTTTYEKHGLRFMYPENWKLTDQSGIDSPHQVELETPQGGIWSLNVFPLESEPESLLDDAVAALKESYEDVEVSSADPDFDEFESIAVEANFYCLDFVVTARIRVISTSQHKLVLLYQAESREFDRQLDVFRAMTLSMLQSIDS